MEIKISPRALTHSRWHQLASNRRICFCFPILQIEFHELCGRSYSYFLCLLRYPAIVHMAQSTRYNLRFIFCFVPRVVCVVPGQTE